MKPLLLLMAAILVGPVLLVQNTFPATGSVGIGTATLNEQREITGTYRLPTTTGHSLL